MEKKNRKVLIVEDNKLNMKLFREILVAENCEVIECSDPMFAMDKLQMSYQTSYSWIFSYQEFLAMI